MMAVVRFMLCLL